MISTLSLRDPQSITAFLFGGESYEANIWGNFDISKEVELIQNPLVFECVLRNAPWCLEEFSIAELSSVIPIQKKYPDSTAVEYAASLGAVECFAILVRRLGVTIDDELLYCCDARFSFGNRLGLWNWLLENANLNFQEHSYGLKGVFESAAQFGSDSFLFAHFGEVFAVNEALYYASNGGRTECVSLLLEHGADVNHDNELPPLFFGPHTVATPTLQAASQQGHLDCVRILLDHGADATLRDEDGNTALSLAAEKGHADCATLLEQHQAELRKKGKRH